MNSVILKENCIDFLTLDLCNYILLAGYNNKVLSQTEYEATVFMLKPLNKILVKEEIEKLFLQSLPVFLLKKDDSGFTFLKDKNNFHIEGKIIQLLSYCLEEDLYKATVIISINNDITEHLLTTILFIVGNEALKNFTGVYALN